MGDENNIDLKAIGARLKGEFSTAQQPLPLSMELLLSQLRAKEIGAAN